MKFCSITDWSFRVINSPLIEFLVGDEKESFFLHRKVVASLSPALRALVTGNMKEAQERQVVWPDVQVETFVLFAQFAYTKDFTILQFRELETQSESEENRAKKRSHDQMTSGITLPATEASKIDTSLSAIFMGHARLYSLAEKYGVVSLKRETLSELDNALSLYSDHDEWVADVVELIQYAFSDDNTPAEGEDSLRKCILECSVRKIRALWQEELFTTMLESQVAFAKLLWPKVAKIMEDKLAWLEMKYPAISRRLKGQFKNT